MAYLFLGQHISQTQKQIAELRKTILGSDGLLDFDFDSLHAHKLDSDTLKKSLESLPAMSDKRLVVVHEADKLSAHNKELVQNFLEAKPVTTELVLVSEKWSEKDSFVKKIRPLVQLQDSGGEEQFNVFDITRNIDYHRPKDALKILFTLLKSGTHPLQLIPGLIWFWGNRVRGKVTDEKFQEGLKAFQEADLSIKRSRLKPDHAVELLIVKLCELR